MMKAETVATLDSDKKERLARVGLKLFFALSEQWKLKVEEQLLLLGLSNRATLNRWKKLIKENSAPTLQADTLERLSLIAGIRKSVEILYPESRWDSYMRQGNRAFFGNAPLEHMLQGSMGNLYDVRRYLDTSRGAHFA